MPDWSPVRNSNWTFWSAMQGVLGRVISNSIERAERGRFTDVSFLPSCQVTML